MKRKFLWLNLGLILCLLISGCMSIGGAKFPESSSNFHPQKQYKVAYDDMWKIVRRVLDAERINILGSDKEGGRVTTDYIQGETQLVAGGLLGVITTRYKYNLSLEKIDPSTTKLNIICTLESSSEGLGWHDVGKDNKELITKLENWLYEKIDKSL